MNFKGEYINGEKNGKGREYYRYGILKFDGEYNNGREYNGIFYKENGIDIDYQLKDGEKV